MREVLYCAFFALFGWYGPTQVLRPLIGLNIRPIPYQKTAAGDVILDLTLSNELVKNVTISGAFLTLTCVWLPLAFLTLLTVFHKCSQAPKAPTAISCLLFAIGLEEIIVQTLKMYVGRLRPNFYSMCGFDKETLQCMAPLAQQFEARQSFPSGHSSLSFCSMGVLMWFGLRWLPEIFGKTISYGNREISPQKSMLVTLAALSPLLYSIFVSTSRIVDNWHHPSDVLAGAIIGFCSATISCHLWLYPLIFERAHNSQHGVNFKRDIEEETSTFLAGHGV